MSAREKAKEVIKEAAYETYEDVKENFESAKDAIKDKFQTAGDAIKQKIENVEETYENVKEDVIDRYEHVKDVLTHMQHEVVGSFLVLIAVFGFWQNARLLAHLSRQTRRDLLVVNLAIANIGLIVTAFPFSTISSFQHEWAFGDNMCNYYGFVSLLFGFVIMTSIAMIAMDEFFLFDWGAYINKRDYYNKLMVAYSWINALFWSITPLYGWSRYAYEPPGTSCSIMHYPNDNYTSYIFTCFVACYLLPALVLYYCKTQYQTAATSKSAHTTQKVAAALSDRTMYLLISFLVCWTPYTVVYLWPIITEERVAPFWLSVVAPVLAKVITVATPVVFLQDYTSTVKTD